MQPSHRARLIFSVLVAALGLLLGTSGCDNSCTELADTVCRCERSEAAQQACLQRVDAEAGSKQITAAEQERCEELLDAEQCTCENLAAGKLEACGLAEQPPP